MKQFKSVLLVKIPYCTHVDASMADSDFRTKAPFRPVPSLAIASICAFFDKYNSYGYDLKAIDLNIEAYTIPSVDIDISCYSKLLTDCIKNSQYDVLALSATFVFNVKWVDMAVRLSRIYHPEAKIIIGGGYPTLFPARALKEHDIDDAIIGEGEATFLHILNKYNNYNDDEFLKKYPFEGYATKDERGIVTIVKRKQDFIKLENVPPPAYYYLDIDKYFKNSGDRKLSIEASRGCPFNCSYCCTYLSWGRKIRYKPVDLLIKEIVGIREQYPKADLHFVDDNMSFSKKWFKTFLMQVIEKKLTDCITASNFSVKRLDEEIIDLMAKANFKQFGIAIETGSQEIQEKINKKLDFNHVRKIVSIMKSRNLHVHICWMVGFPGETMEQINATINFARELRGHSNQFLTVTPYPGTKLFDEARASNLLIFNDDDLDKFDNRRSEYLISKEWNYEQLKEIIYDANIEMNFLNNPCFDTTESMEYFLEYLENLLIRLPDHIIVRIIVGYLYKQCKHNFIKYINHYKIAIEHFKDKSLYNTFNKYLSWGNPVVKDFQEYVKNEGIKLQRISNL